MEVEYNTAAFWVYLTGHVAAVNRTTTRFAAHVRPNFY